MNLSNIDWYLVYAALIHSIRTNTGTGFLNNDQGHPAYTSGENGDPKEMGDGPESNKLYKTLLEIYRHQPPLDNLPKIDSWKAFCELAVESERKNRKWGGSGEAS